MKTGRQPTATVCVATTGTRLAEDGTSGDFLTLVTTLGDTDTQAQNNAPCGEAEERVAG